MKPTTIPQAEGDLCDLAKYSLELWGLEIELAELQMNIKSAKLTLDQRCRLSTSDFSPDLDGDVVYELLQSRKAEAPLAGDQTLRIS